jgi:hypothetical protein
MPTRDVGKKMGEENTNVIACLVVGNEIATFSDVAELRRLPRELKREADGCHSTPFNG